MAADTTEADVVRTVNTAADMLSELSGAIEDMNAGLRIMLDHFDPPAPGPRERHLRLVHENEGEALPLHHPRGERAQ